MMTQARLNALRYFKAIADKDVETKRKLSFPDPRPVSWLCQQGFLAVVGHHYGPIHGITEAGRAELIKHEG